jgi:hypothetical protein
MAERKAFLIRIEPAVLEALQRWAGDDLRSVNGQIEYVLRRALQREGRLSGMTSALNTADDTKPSAEEGASEP